MPIIDHPEHALIGPIRDQRRHLAESHGLDAEAVPAARLTLVHGLAHGETAAVREVSATLDDELRQHLVDGHNVNADRMPPAGTLETFHSEVHSLTNPAAGHDPQGSPAALAGAAQRSFELLAAALRDLDAVDHPLALDVAEQFADRLLRRFAP